MTAPQDWQQPPTGPDGPPRKGPGKGLLGGVIAGVVVVALAAVAVVYVNSGDEPGTPTAGASTPGTGTDGTPDAADPRAGAIQELEEIHRQSPERPPKEDGYPSHPKTQNIRIGADAIYTLYHNEKTVYLTAFGLEKNEVLWEQDRRVEDDGVIDSAGYTVVDGALLLTVEVQGAPILTTVLDPLTGEELWHDNFTPGCSRGCVYGNRVLRDDRKGREGPETLALDVLTGKQVWSVPLLDDQPSYTWIRQQTAEAMDAGYLRQGFTERYVGYGQQATGTTQIIDTETGEIVSEGVLGEKVMDYLLVDEVLYVYRQTPRDLKAYSIKDLSTPLWTEAMPAARDGSALFPCHVEVLCLRLDTDSGQLLRGVEMASGKTLWETGEYQNVDRAQTEYAGGPIALTAEGGTFMLDAMSGERLDEFPGFYFTYLGAGVALVRDNDVDVAADVVNQKRLDLGPSLGDPVNTDECVWDEAYAVCAHEEEWEYSIWRYRD